MHEIRFTDIRAEGRTLSGTVIRYGDEARLPWGREVIRSGAFGDVRAQDVILNRQHDRALPLARTGGGGLFLEDGAEALSVRAELPETRDSDDVLTLIRQGVLRGLSLEFTAKEESYEGDLRIISRAALQGVAVVDKPAYPSSLVQARMARLETPKRGRRRFLVV